MILDRASRTFLEGYRVGLERAWDMDALYRILLDFDPELRPFAFEGGAMAARTRDCVDSGGRAGALLGLVDPAWDPLVRLGIGCALARLGTDLPADPMTADGFGFQVGLKSGTVVSDAGLGSAEADRGRGRALWFAAQGRLDVCVGRISGRASAGALWRGVATACAFAGDPYGEAERLLGAGGGFEEEIRAGVRHAAALWTALEGEAPARTVAVERAVRAGR